jgi:hypothetical protein
VHREIESELTSLPPQFFGTVEITFQAGLPTFIRTTRARKLEPKLPSIGDQSARDRK